MSCLSRPSALVHITNVVPIKTLSLGTHHEYRACQDSQPGAVRTELTRASVSARARRKDVLHNQKKSAPGGIRTAAKKACASASLEEIPCAKMATVISRFYTVLGPFMKFRNVHLAPRTNLTRWRSRAWRIKCSSTRETASVVVVFNNIELMMLKE